MTAAHTTRAERRRQARAERKNRDRIRPVDGDYGIQPGWFAGPDHLEEAKRLSHDLLIESMGDRRTGPVQWLIWEGEAAKATLAKLRNEWRDGQPLTADEAETFRQLAAHFREYGGCLIVAMAEGRRPTTDRSITERPAPWSDPNAEVVTDLLNAGRTARHVTEPDHGDT